MPRVSVVIPTADRGHALNAAIECVGQQSLKPLEVIVVDNGRANAVVPAGGMVKVVRTDPYIGPGSARNVGALSALGDYVAFLDDDDYWDPDYLKHVAKLINDSKPDVVLGQLMRLLPGQRPVMYKLFPAVAAQQRQVYFRNPGFGGQNLTIKRSVFLDLGGFDVTMPASEDRDLAARLLQAGKQIVPCDSAIAVLVDHEGPRARQRLVEGNWRFIRKHWRFMTKAELFKATITLVKRWAAVRTGRVSHG